MAQDMVAVMEQLGFARFYVRDTIAAAASPMHGARRCEKHRAADRARHCGSEIWQMRRCAIPLSYWLRSLLTHRTAPERMTESPTPSSTTLRMGLAIGRLPAGCPRRLRCGSARSCPAHAICEEYRAAVGLDRRHDQADRDAGRKIRCPVLALWSAEGALDTWYTGRTARAVARLGRRGRWPRHARRTFLCRGDARANRREHCAGSSFQQNKPGSAMEPWPGICFATEGGAANHSPAASRGRVPCHLERYSSSS